MMLMAAAVAAILLAALGLPVFTWLRLELGGAAWAFWFVWLVPFLSLPLSYSVREGKVRTWMHRIGECCMGAVLYISMTFILKAAVLLVMSLSGSALPAGVRIWAGRAAFLLFLMIYLAGVLTALRIKTVRLEITAPVKNRLRLVLLSDLHLGFFTGRRMTERIASAVNGERPDAVLFAGDIFDMDYPSLRDPERHARAVRSITAPLGKYACLGNHDMLNDDPRKDEWIRGCGITVMHDETEHLGDIVLLGRRDVSDEERMTPEEAYKAITPGAYAVVLDHNPSGYRSEWDHGASLLLCGHTHGGQTFPLDILQKLVMPIPVYGYRRAGEKSLFVTSGAGFWGPPLRLGVRNEIVRIDLVQEKSESTDAHDRPC